jgi:hypothetical protein
MIGELVKVGGRMRTVEVVVWVVGRVFGVAIGIDFEIGFEEGTMRILRQTLLSPILVLLNNLGLKSMQRLIRVEVVVALEKVIGGVGYVMCSVSFLALSTQAHKK